MDLGEAREVVPSLVATGTCPAPPHVLVAISRLAM
jgi:hypothetical protein